MFGIDAKELEAYQTWAGMVRDSLNEIQKKEKCFVVANVEEGFYWMVRDGR